MVVDYREDLREVRAERRTRRLLPVLEGLLGVVGGGPHASASPAQTKTPTRV